MMYHSREGRPAFSSDREAALAKVLLRKVLDVDVLKKLKHRVSGVKTEKIWFVFEDASSKSSVTQ